MQANEWETSHRNKRKTRAEREKQIDKEIQRLQKETVLCGLCYTQMKPCINPYGILVCVIVYFVCLRFFCCVSSFSLFYADSQFQFWQCAFKFKKNKDTNNATHTHSASHKQT